MEPVFALREARLSFDGGAMFGHVPKTVWSRLVEADGLNRVRTACNTLLAHMNGRWVLTDPGMGTRWNEKERDLYALEVPTYEEILAPAGIAPADIALVILSHLHIDHAGGLTKWDANGHVVPVFPNAHVAVQKGEIEAALNPDLRSRPSYRLDDFEWYRENGRLIALEGETEVLPGVTALPTGGHTAHHQVLRFDLPKETVWFLADIYPSTAHLKPHWVMGYDLFPLDVIAARQRLLPDLLAENTRALLGHDPGHLLGRFHQQQGKVTFNGEAEPS